MKRLFLILFALLLIAGFVILTGTGSVFAQDDDGTTTNGDNGEPELDPTDNWCFDPDRWGDGRCNVEGDIWLTNWYYICGYYRARVESGEYPKGPEGQLVADGCLVPLPPPHPVSAAGKGGGAICFIEIISLWCLDGNILTIDLGNDGSVDVILEVRRDDTDGNGGKCDDTLGYDGDVGGAFPELYDLLSQFFDDFDDICIIAVL